MMTRTVLAAVAVAIGVSAAVAQQDAVKARKDLMSSFAKPYYGDLRKMVRGQEPYDRAKASAGFAVFADDSQKLAAAFAPNVMPATPSDYDASPKIWQNKADFDAKVAAFVKAAADNRDAAKDLDSLKTAYQNVTKACDACHESYRVKNR
jgi:cytochrome c556